MEGRRWCPEAWLDEVVPKLCSHPTGFLVEVDGGWRLREPNLTEGDFWDEPITVGTVVEFGFTENRSSFTVEINEDQSWTVVEGSIPTGDGVFYWIDRDPETMSDGVDDVIEYARESDASIHRVEIDTYYWSPRSFPFRFELVDGAPSFAPLDDAAREAVAAAAEPAS